MLSPNTSLKFFHFPLFGRYFNLFQDKILLKIKPSFVFEIFYQTLSDLVKRLKNGQKKI